MLLKSMHFKYLSPIKRKLFVLAVYAIFILAMAKVSARSGEGSLGAGRYAQSFNAPNARFAIETAKGMYDSCPVLVQFSEELEFDADNKPTGRHIGNSMIAWLGRPFRLISKTEKVAIWEASLSRKYNQCRGTAYLDRLNGIPIAKEKSYVFLKFEKGIIRLTLDLNTQASSSIILNAEVTKAGSPSWRWSEAAAVNYIAPASTPLATKH